MKNFKKFKIHIYQGIGTTNIDIGEISKYLFTKLGWDLKIYHDFLGKHTRKEDLNLISKKIATLKVLNLKELNKNPMYAEIEFEKKRIIGKSKTFGIMYDGFNLMNIFQELIPKNKKNINNCHIILTNRLIGTYDKNDLRYHARVIICGFPNIISTTGLIEAPAKPREYYLLKSTGFLNNQIKIEEIKKKLIDRILTHDDNRLTEVLKGYFLQAILFQVIPEIRFCEKENCRIFNAHWQEEVIKAQMTIPEFCENHKKMIDELQ